MFDDMSSLTFLDLGSSFNTSKVTNMGSMFRNVSSLPSLDLKNSFDTSSVTSTYQMFHGMRSLKILDLGHLFNTSNVTTMGFMFQHLNSLENLNLGSMFSTSNVTEMTSMFYGMSSITTLDLSLVNFDTSKVTSMGSMFRNMSSLTSLDLGPLFNTSRVTKMNSMFHGMSLLTILDLSLVNFDTSIVTDMQSMFSDMSSLTSLNLGASFNTSSVRSMSEMFKNTSLTSLDLSSFDTGRVTNMISMFYGMSSLNFLNLGIWETDFLSDSSSFFSRTGSPIISTSKSNPVLYCLNNDDGDAANGNDLLIAGSSYSCSSFDCNQLVSNLDSGTYISAFIGENKPVNCINGTTPSITSVNCTSGGFDSVPSCIPVSCPDTEIPNSDYSVASSLTGSFLDEEVNIKCDLGYTGGGKWSCGADGNWIGNLCVPKSSPSSPTFSETYSESDFHCDLNDDGIEGSGEVIDFPDHSFVLEFTLDDDLLVSLPTSIQSDSDFYIAWGDESCSHITSLSSTNDLEYTFESSGSKIVRIIGDVHIWGQTLYKSNYQGILSKVLNLGDVSWDDLGNAFSSSNVSYFSAKHSETSAVSSMASMFKKARSLEVLSLNGLNTSNVTNMSEMFNQMTEVSSIYFGSEFDTSNVLDMSIMFGSTLSLSSLDLSHFVTDSVTSMEQMFYYSGINEVDLSSFNTEDVTSMKRMFSRSKIKNLDLSSFNTPELTTTKSMFSYATYLSSINFGTSFNTSKVNDMTTMFSGVSLESLDVSMFDTTNVSQLISMFSSSNIPNLDLSMFNTSNVVNMDGMFIYSTVSSLNLGEWETNNATSFQNMFFHPLLLETLVLAVQTMMIIIPQMVMKSFLEREPWMR